jgi:hypothetical protein
VLTWQSTVANGAEVQVADLDALALCVGGSEKTVREYANERATLANLSERSRLVEWNQPAVRRVPGCSAVANRSASSATYPIRRSNRQPQSLYKYA